LSYFYIRASPGYSHNMAQNLQPENSALFGNKSTLLLSISKNKIIFKTYKNYTPFSTFERISKSSVITSAVTRNMKK